MGIPRILVPLLAAYISSVSGLNVEDTPTEDFQFHVQLDPNYQLHWMFNETHIMFETVVKTTGYIGFGISETANMFPADVIVTGVSNGVPYLYDGYTVAHSAPSVDKHLDWFLISANESNGVTTSRFWRLLNTCDPQDRPILEGTSRIIFSYHPEDVKPSDPNPIQYHGSNRGSKSLLLLDPPDSVSPVNNFPTTTRTLDFVTKNFSVPDWDTTYHCVTFALPDLGSKHHMIRYEPIIQKGHEKLVHHILLYYCQSKKDPTLAGRDYNCFTEALPEFHDCFSVMVAWAIGGQGFDFPSHVGYPLGTDADPGFFIMETHYDNPAKRSDFVDNSGLRLILTPELRANDAGTIELGSNVNDHMVIPAYSKEFLNTGYCTSICLDEGLGDKEIQVFANLLHSHLIGRALRTRHIRGGTELAPLAQDNNYDFNYQEMRKLRKEVTVKKGDSFIVECLYKSPNKSSTTFGGLTTQDEMCLSYAMYYPRIPLTTCRSEVNYWEHHHGNRHQWVDSFDWTQQSSHDTFQNITRHSSIRMTCAGSKSFTNYGKYTMQDFWQPRVKYQEPNVCTK